MTRPAVLGVPCDCSRLDTGHVIPDRSAVTADTGIGLCLVGRIRCCTSNPHGRGRQVATRTGCPARGESPVIVGGDCHRPVDPERIASWTSRLENRLIFNQ